LSSLRMECRERTPAGGDAHTLCTDGKRYLWKNK
jgi:hypothetical protein